MILTYALTPFVAWLVTGITKFAVNCLKEKRLALDRIGYGGMPSNHSAIVGSMVTLVGLREGIDSPSFGIALTLAFIVVMDAASLRRHVGRQAERINLLSADKNLHSLRERLGHTRAEIFCGLMVGAVVAYGMCHL